MKKTAAKNLKLALFFAIIICVTGAVYTSISKSHVKEYKKAAASKSDGANCKEDGGEELSPVQFVSFRIMELL